MSHPAARRAANPVPDADVPGEVAAEVDTDAGRPVADPARLRLVADRAAPVTLARDRTLPVPDALGPLVGPGLRRGSTVTIEGSGARSVGFALASAASVAGSWVALVGLDDLGVAAAADLGLRLERLAVVHPVAASAWSTVVATLVGAVDVICVAPTHRVRPGDIRRLTARARERGSVLVELTPTPRPGGDLWGGAELRLAVEAIRWEGLGVGHGHLRARRVAVTATGRRHAARPRRAELWLPGPDGVVSPVSPVSSPGADLVPDVLAPDVLAPGDGIAGGGAGPAAGADPSSVVAALARREAG